MSERVIAIQGTSFAGSRDIVLKPDPEAPSVSEVVDCLRDFRGDLSSAQRNLACEQAIRWAVPADKRRTDMEIKTDQERVDIRLHRIDNLIARLEGA